MSATESFLRFRDAGDVESLALVFDRTAPDLLRVARAVNRSDAEDLLQATFLKAIQSASTFEKGRRVEPWLLGILVNEARNVQRRNQRRAHEPVVNEPVDRVDASERASAREVEASVNRGLRRLPQAYREVLEPFLRDGARGVEIAARLGRAPGTVRVQIHRGLALLRRLLPSGLGCALVGAFAPRLLAITRVRRAVLAGGRAKVGTTTLLGSLVMKQGVVLTLASAILVAALLLAFDWFDGVPASQERVSEIPTGPAVAQPVAEPERRGDEALDRSPAAAAPSGAGATARPEVTAATDYEVLVVDPEGAPIEAATVVLLDFARLSDRELLGFESGGVDIAALLDRFGQRRQSDAQGRVAVSTYREGLVLLAGERDEHRGMQLVRPQDPRPIELELRPSQGIRARVVDARGHATIGVPVALRSKRGRDRRTVFWSRTRAPDGIAELAFVHTALALGGGDTLLTGPELLVLPPLEQQVLPGPVRELYDFALPPTASVEIVLDDPSGSRARGNYQVTVIATQNGEPGGPEVRSTRAMAAGRCVFDHVGLGLDLRIEVRSSAYATRVSSHAGPIAAGQQLLIRLPPRDLPIVSARALVDGQPIVNERLRLVFKDPAAGDSQRRATRTDELGTFHFELPRPYEAGIRTLEVRRDGADGERRLIDLSRTLGSGVADLGDIELQAAPVLVAGRVIDDSEGPVGGAVVRVFRLRERGGDYVWDDLRELDCTTDAAGRFTVRGWLVDVGCAIEASHPEFATGPLLEVEPGSDNVVYRLPPQGHVAGQVVLDERVSSHALRLQLYDAWNERYGPSHAVTQSGSFAIAGALEGTYRLTARATFGTEVELATNLKVRAGELLDVGELDLRALVHPITIAVADGTGTAVEGAAVEVRAASDPSGSWRAYRTSNRGEIELISTHAELDVKVTATGFTSRARRIAGGRSVITLETEHPGGR